MEGPDDRVNFYEREVHKQPEPEKLTELGEKLLGLRLWD